MYMTHRISPLAAVLLGTALASALPPGLAQEQRPVAAASAPSKAPVLTAAQIDALVERTMKAFDVPGISVAVVKDGKTIVAKGYGVRSLNGGEKMDGDTLAGIASNTKAFTVAALGILVDEKKLKWDDKVTDFIPEFRLYNPYVTEEFTVRDLLTHRSGLGLGAGDLMFWPYGTDFTTGEVIRNLRFLKQASSFRSRYDYDNLLYIVAGEVVKRVSGMSWEEFIERKVMQPLDMKSSAASLARVKDVRNVVTPHVRVDRHVQPITARSSETVNAAGGIYSSVNDMAKWVGMLLAKGRLGASGKRLISEAVLREAWTPQTIIPAAGGFYNTHFTAYGLGWVLNDMAGYKQVGHNGGVLGMVSQVSLVPELDLGIVVLTNQEQATALSAIVGTVLDGYLGMPVVDRIRMGAEQEAAQAAAADQQAAALWSAIEAAQGTGGKREIDLKQYAGRYRDPWFGDVVIGWSEGRLTFRAQRSLALDGVLTFYKGTTFIVKWKDRTLNADAFVNFALGTDGLPTGFGMEAVSPQTDFSYDFHDLDMKRVRR